MRPIKNCVQLTILPLFLIFSLACTKQVLISDSILIKPSEPLILDHIVSGNRLKKMVINLTNKGNYANLSVYANNILLVDNINVPTTGQQVLNTLVNFPTDGNVKLKIVTKGAELFIDNIEFKDVDNLAAPLYKDITVAVGMDKASSIKYGGPTIADIDNDGDYDFIVNNHNAETSKLYWNNGDGTVTKHNKNLARWFMQDLHGTAVGDYDNDGDLDLVLTMGGGNGKIPSKNNIYHNNNGTLVLSTGDVGIDHGGRGRGAKWSDIDLDGDLDLMMFNESSLTHSKPQHFFYKNLGDGTFDYTPIKGLEDQEPSRALITDINNDNIDDVILYSPLTIWQGNGDFTFTDVTAQIPADVAKLNSIMALTDIDIDNDGDLDLYLAQGKVFEHGYGESPSVDHDPISKEFSIKPRGNEGVNTFDFTADSNIKFHQYNYLTQGAFRGKDYPIFLGSKKSATVLKNGEELDITPSESEGWPNDISENGVYFGHIGNGKWKSALVRNGNIFWTFRFSLSGVNDVTLGFEPENRNISDILLRNDGGKFVDVSKQWNLPKGGNALGVTTGDFNNDSHQDLFVYRWGLIGSRISDYMLLNTGNGSFETMTMHGANDIGGPGNGDMGQAFDFDLDGDLDLLNGSEDGEWYLYANEQTTQVNQGNYALVNVGYAPKSNVDAISAEVMVTTPSNVYRKRVGSAGAIFSQSLLNIVHFGLGKEEIIKSIKVRWRNGETVVIANKKVNQLFDTNKIDPKSISITPSIAQVRKGTSIQLQSLVTPINADKNMTWASSDEAIVRVNKHGEIKATGDANQTATITATSKANQLVSQSEIKIVEWFAKPLQSISLATNKQAMVVGDEIILQANIMPKDADNQALTWSSSDRNVATVNVNGKVNAIAQGKVTIKATSQSNKEVKGEFQLNVEPLIESFISIVDADKMKDGALVAGEEITLTVNYHAGTGNHVISADEGGVRFWLRHFQSKWIPVKDIILTDTSVLKSISGSSTMTISLKDVLATEDLPEGHFYVIRASFSSSDGSQPDTTVYPINIIKGR